MERTGGVEPPFSAPFTDHRFVAGVVYVRMFGRGSGPRSRITTLRGSYPVQLDDAPMAPIPGIPGVAPGSTRLMRPHGSLTDLPASELVSAGRFERPLSALSTRSLCRLGYADELEDHRGHDPRTCRLRAGRSAH
jgi:hypothetical protein